MPGAFHHEANSIFLYGTIEQNLQLLLNMYSRTFQSLLNLTKAEIELKLVENVGGSRFWLNMRLNLRKIKGGGSGSRPIFSDRKK